MAEPITDFDPADSLQSREAIALFLSDAFETGGASHLASALRVALRAAQINQIIEAAGLPPCDLNDLPLATVLAVMKALGLRPAVAPAGPAPNEPRRIPMAELLAAAERLPEIHGGVAGALDGPPVGREPG